jgi:hypothetical protein
VWQSEQGSAWEKVSAVESGSVTESEQDSGWQSEQASEWARESASASQSA